MVTYNGTPGPDTFAGGGEDDLINGLDGNDSLSGGGGADTIYGGAGDDSLDGLGGVDYLDGGDGNDLLFQSLNASGEPAGDTMVGGAGNDTLSIADSSVAGYAYYVDLSTGTGNFNKVYDGIENVIGGNMDDTLTGNDEANLLDGGAGNDIIDGRGGNDTLTGGDGDDDFIAATGDDTITDFGLGESGSGDDGNSDNNDFIDLSGYYNQANYDAAVASGDIDPDVIGNPLAWMRADQADDGILNDTAAGWDADNSLTIQNGGSAVAGDVLTTDRTGVTCYATGTLITTPDGPRPVESLKVGDLVMTLDNGAKPVLWIGRRKLTARDLDKKPNLRPIRIAAGALGRGLPRRDLIVSPQHRIMVESRIVERMFGTRQILAAASAFLALKGVSQIEDAEAVEYIHFLCDQHEIVFAEGLASESLYTGAEALKSLSIEARQEVFGLFPELQEMDADSLPRAARTFSKTRKAEKVVARHMANGAELVAMY